MRPSKSSRLELDEIKGHKSETKWINKNQVHIDMTYQRAQKAHTINGIAREWDWDLAGAIDVVLRSDGKYYAMDGGGRVEAAKRRPDVAEILCLVHKFHTVQEEAAFFNARSVAVVSLNALDRHKSAVAAGLPLAIAIQAALEENGLRVSGCQSSTAKGTIRCLAAVEKAMRLSPAECREALRLATLLSEGETVEHDLFEGLFSILCRSPEVLSPKNVDKLVTQTGYARLKKSITRASVELGGRTPAYAIGILNCINLGRRRKVYLESR